MASASREPAFVLVHSPLVGPTSWLPVARELERRGRVAVIPSLLGVAEAPEPRWRHVPQAVRVATSHLQQRVVLVGHSRGGIAISQAAEARADRIRTLVYLAAYVLRDGETVVDWAGTDTASLVMPDLDVAEDHTWDMLRADAFDAALYADCPAEDVALAHLLLTPEPLAPSLTPLRLTAQRYGRIPRAYIELTQDRAVTPGLQQRMHAATPCARVTGLAASHSAYFSAPEALTGELTAIAADPRLAAPVLTPPIPAT